ncbi:MAG TPA: LysR family transcriptional regulator, partial [Roseomonas sp.]
MHLSALEIFCAVAADCSVTQASKALGRVPSNVTTRIQQLEQELGVALFSRGARRMTLTREGEIFLAYAHRILALMSEARQAVDPGPPAGRLRIGSMESSAATRLPQILKTFRALYPGIAVQLTMGATRDLAAQVLDHALDGALVAEPARRDG